MVRRMIGINPAGKRLGQAALQPDPFSKVFNHGSEEAVSKSQSQAEAAPGHRSLLADTFKRCRQPIQHDCERGHVRDGVAVLIRS
jgi:hypothetical protein